MKKLNAEPDDHISFVVVSRSRTSDIAQENYCRIATSELIQFSYQ